MACAGVAEAVMAQFAALPKTGKPQPHEHTVLAGMALSLPAAGASIGWPDGGGSSVAPRAWPQQELAVVAIGTGTKCLGAFKRLPGGGAVNDCHAEVLCRRALLRWLYGEARQVVERYRQAVQQAAGQLDAPAAAAAAATRVLRLVPPAGGDGTAGDLFGGWRCELQPGVGLHLYISQPPCGDASILGPAASCHHPQHQHQQHQPPQETRGSQAARQHSSPEAAAAAACADSRGGGGSAQAQAGGFGRTGAKALKRQRIGGSGDQLSAAPSGPVEEAQQAHCEQQPGMQEQQQEEQWRLPQQHEVEPYAQAQAVGVGALLGGLLASPLHLSSVTVPLQHGEAAGSAAPSPTLAAVVGAAAAADKQPQVPSSASVAEVAELALRRALLDRTAELAAQRLPPGFRRAPPALHIHVPGSMPAPGSGSSGGGGGSEGSRAHSLGLAPSATRRVAGGSSVVWFAPPSPAFKWKRQAGSAADVLSGGSSEAVIGGTGLKAGSARVQAGQAAPPSAHPSVCKAALFAQWQELAAALRSLSPPPAVALAPDAAADIPARPEQPQRPPPEQLRLQDMRYGQAKRAACPQYAAAWQGLLQPPSPLHGWIPKPAALEEFALAPA
ncbi:hypothetical protein CHLNCDRAFT_133846 [Chlorella variabilis]|uniref:tRNA-specific adenosine deaminase 1 n=1 Tax=Chlorella variabilis TaxID=554065 RepID=E1ZFD3_CHLVA|nr:hypothetical protein CHLNCDRAFT_133846 [Chlorella variabilis]EFN55483.1 hypothetical protein CHLNCDRAFT_133846 [Chlorella variabilis]|eukprot:XP_005847585.1 hypothetical protein CHLNCDRAFT_133846 [Chlorella variabilis]